MATLLLILGIALSSALLVQYLPIPYTVVLVAVGGLLGLANVQLGFSLNHDLVFHVFLPLLLFEAALHVDLRLLRGTLQAAILLAGPGVLIVMLIVGMGLSLTAGLNL